MGLMDKLKTGAGGAKDLASGAAGQAKDLAGDVASRAKQEAKEMQLKRDLGDATDDLGKTAFELWEHGEIDHPMLESRARRVRSLRDDLAALQDGGGAPPGDDTAPPAAGEGGTARG